MSSFFDGTPLTHVNQATYLGGILSKEVNPVIEIQNRIAGCIPILRTLDIFWKKTNCPLKLKLNVFNAVIISKLVYGLETFQYTEAVGRKLDVFQMKGLRKTMRIIPTLIDRTHTNENVFASK